MYLLLILLPLIGLFLGSIFDRGARAEGNIRNDLPSTLGFLIGLALSIYLVLKN
jgi:hypothetical protein